VSLVSFVVEQRWYWPRCRNSLTSPPTSPPSNPAFSARPSSAFAWAPCSCCAPSSRAGSIDPFSPDVDIDPKWPASRPTKIAALDGDVEGLCQRLERLRSPGTIWVASCGRLRAAGFTLAATDASPHFDVVLPSLTPDIVESVRACFEARANPAKDR